MSKSLRNGIMYSVQGLFPNQNWDGLTPDRLHRCFNACFNVTFDQIELLVLRIRYIWGPDIKQGWRIDHLLWTLLYLKTYPSEDYLECLIGKDKRTIKKWILYTVDLIAEIDMVRY